ncbi:hypothetical protein J31TS6_14030 [Brevibacillus reuszeri]|uniref:hypothetical protein n=1 Tax=Brevibacillus reuszeri TaxID=54915 RepID=UPI001B1005FC|nr:hypothetical protein [Brevibacillus reuszeri]GIO05375.1 hypothetical protein J31TS6_14030 [Brevibacillus reuszeri]
MAEHYRFFDSTADDERVYTADEFAEYFRRVLTDGIFNGGTNLKVETNGTDIRTYIQPGYAWVQGYMYKIDTEPLYLQHEYPDPNLDRIDRVVIRLDKRLEHRYVRAFILKGTPASSPVPPLLMRDENVFELSLAQVRIIKGKSYIEGPQITDERLNNSVCGLVNSLIQADTTTIFNQFQHWYNSRTVVYQQEWADWLAAATTQFGKEWTDWLNVRKKEWADWFGSVQTNGFISVVDKSITYNIGPGGDYVTLQDALHALRTVRIPWNVVVTLAIKEGVHSYSQLVEVNHPDGNRIYIQGADPIVTQIATVGQVTGVKGEWLVPVTVQSSAGMKVGQYAIIKKTTGTGDHYAHQGVWEIVSISSNLVTVKNLRRVNDLFPASTVTGGNFTVLPTTIKCLNGSGFRIWPGRSLGLIKRLAIIGMKSNAGSAIVATSGAAVDVSEIGVVGFSYGIRAREHSHINAYETVASGNQDIGIFAGTHSSINASGVIATANGYGISANDGSNIYALSSVASGNNTNGFFASKNSHINASSSIASGSLIGFYATETSSIYATGAVSYNNIGGVRSRASSAIDASLAVVTQNESYAFLAEDSGSIYAPQSKVSDTLSPSGADYRALRMGLIYCNGFVGTPTFSPQLNVEGNHNAMITDRVV